MVKTAIQKVEANLCKHWGFLNLQSHLYFFQDEIQIMLHIVLHLFLLCVPLYRVKIRISMLYISIIESILINNTHIICMYTQTKNQLNVNELKNMIIRYYVLIKNFLRTYTLRSVCKQYFTVILSIFI